MPAPRNDTKANLMYDLYQQGHSLAEIGNAFGVTRQSVYKVFHKRGFPLRTPAPPIDVVEFQGTRYTRRAHGYYASTCKPRRYLHRDIYEASFGPIPDGFDVHHRNGNKADNRIDNLELLSSSDHGKLHAETNEGFKRTQFQAGRKGMYHPRKSR